MFVGLDTFDYLSDIIFLRVEDFSFKTAYFVKRNWRAFSHGMGHVWEECVKVWEG
jgi:hypothetical protein